MHCSPSTVEQEGIQDFQCVVLPRNHIKLLRSLSENVFETKSLESEVAWQDDRQVDQRLHVVFSCKTNMKSSLPSMLLHCFHRFTHATSVVYRNIICLLVLWSYL